MKIALVHDYLKEYGGAERVLMALHEIYPQAPIYTIFCKKNSSAFGIIKEIGNIRVVESWFAKLPFCDRLISPLRFLIPLIWKSFDFSEYDLVISSASWAITKGFADKKAKEICYCHTPPRYLYGYETSRNWKKHWYVRFYATIVNHFMRMYDFNQAQRVSFFIANSREVQQRIKKFYRRESIIINPPVDIPKFEIRSTKFETKEYFLTGGRLEAAKNFELVIRACNLLKVPLKIYGSGSQEKYLQSIASETIDFLGRVSEEEKSKLMAGCKAFIAAASDEDFGITPVEAMAAGKPVIAYKKGGYLETVIEGKTGEFIMDLTPETLAEKLRNFNGNNFKSADCRKQAGRFSKENFRKKIISFIDSSIKQGKS